MASSASMGPSDGLRSKSGSRWLEKKPKHAKCQIASSFSAWGVSRARPVPEKGHLLRGVQHCPAHLMSDLPVPSSALGYSGLFSLPLFLAESVYCGRGPGEATLRTTPASSTSSRFSRSLRRSYSERFNYTPLLSKRYSCKACHISSS